jgi:hypothetical protein
VAALAGYACRMGKKPATRDRWIEGHPDLAAARDKLRKAEEAAATVAWTPDPYAFAAAVKAAEEGADAAADALQEVEDALATAWKKSGVSG